MTTYARRFTALAPGSSPACLLGHRLDLPLRLSRHRTSHGPTACRPGVKFTIRRGFTPVSRAPAMRREQARSG